MSEMIRVRQERGDFVLLAVAAEPSQVSIFDAFLRIEPDKGGELQLTGAVDLLISEGHPVHVVVQDGIRHDLGNPAGFVPASVEFSLRHSEYGPALFHDLEAIMEKFRLERN